MASASTHRIRGNLQKAHYQQIVCLADWWLIKAENELAVAGLTSHEKQGMRVFSSGPILKRHNVFNVETTDGICIILDGFINKDRTLENGFPSDVFNYFLFGFPQYWKEYYEKFMGKESSSMDISVNLLKKPSPNPGMEGGQKQVDSHGTDFGSQGKMNAKGIRESKTTKSSDFALAAQRCGSVIRCSENNLNMPSITLEGLQMESYPGGRSGEDHTTLELPVNSLKNKIKSVFDSSCEQRTTVPAVIDNDVEYSQINDSRGILSACHLYKGRRKRATDNSKNVESEKNNSMKASLDRDLSLSEDILSCNEVGVRTRQMSSLKMNQKNNETSGRISGTEMRFISVSSTAPEKVESASVDCQLGSGNNWNFEVTGLNRPTDKKIQLRLLDAGSVNYGFDQVPKTPNQDKGMGKIKTKINIQKAKNKATKSLHTLAAADNQTDKTITGTDSLSKKAKASTVETRRKSAHGSKETSHSGKEKVPSASPQPSSFNRSRSGRLLIPALEFWRNQIPVYDMGRTITGIEEGAPSEQPKIRSRSTSQRNKRKRK